MKRLLALALLLSACGPSTTRLVAHKHYREALCADPGDEDVAKALFADTNAHVHLHVVTDEELARAVGDDAPNLQARGRFVRFSLETNRIPIDGIRLAITSEPAVLSSPSWTRLAQLTGERLPPREQRTTSLTGKNLLNGAAIFLTAGLWLLTDPSFERGVIEVDAPLEKYRAMAPKAYALRDATQVDSGACVGEAPNPKREESVALTCSTYFVVDQPLVAGSRPADLVLTFEYVAYRWKPEERDYMPNERDQCLARHVVRVPLETMPDSKPRRVADRE